jgi:hypothetical protein
MVRDQKIAKRILELDALLDGGVKAFVLVSGQLTNAENAAIIIKAMPKILKMIEQNNFPFIAKIQRHSTVALWKTKRAIRKGIHRKARKK